MPVVGFLNSAAPDTFRQLLVLNASTPSEINAAFATLRQRRADALLDPFFSALPLRLSIFFLEGGAMNFIEKSAITTKAYWLRVYRSCPNFAQ
jgi:hypothetical protein